jgi:hypothetical protein
VYAIRDRITGKGSTTRRVHPLPSYATVTVVVGMARTVHGIMSIVLVVGAVGIGAAAIMPSSMHGALGYLAISALSAVTMVASFCTRCPHRGGTCPHVVPGRLAALLPAREPGPYNLLDSAGVAVPGFIILLAPQYWLISSFSLFLVFWTLALVGFAEIRTFVCGGCENGNCPMRK